MSNADVNDTDAVETAKTKPLSLSDFKLIYVKSINFEDFHASLIRDGFCRRSAEDE
jgi:hypothetical protein